MGVIEVDFFSEEVDSADHPEAEEFRRLLEAVADEYECSLLSFEVERGTVSFSFDDDVLTAEVLNVLGVGKPERKGAGRKRRKAKGGKGDSGGTVGPS